MLLKESERIELKESTSQMRKGLIALSSMLNKHGSGTLYFGVKWGTGIKRISAECKAAGVRVKFEKLKSGFQVTFFRPDIIKEKPGRKGGQVTTQETTQKTTRKILALIEQNPHVTRKNLSRLVGNITEDGIKYNLAVLVKAGNIKRVGPDKGGFWKVTKGKNETAF